MGYMGNGARGMELCLPWHVLRQRNLAEVALALRQITLQNLEELRTRIQYNLRPPHSQDVLFHWNSWARVQELLEADFGSDLKRWEWVMLRRLEDERAFMLVPATRTGGLTLQVALRKEEMEDFLQTWNRLITPPEAA